jgi:prepilin-type N-terminal cleavage/methylation domain-containing protein
VIYIHFTLIELIIVISIIAILASILLPALNKAKDKANAIKCMSNQSNIYKAYLFYANDNDDYILPTCGEVSSWVDGKAWTLRLQDGEYLKNILSPAMRCPSLKLSKKRYNTEHYGAMVYSNGSKIHSPRYVGINQNNLPPKTKICKPSEFMLLVDSIKVSTTQQEAYIAWKGNSSWSLDRRIHLRHNRHANITSAAGDVLAYSLNNIGTKFLSPNYSKRLDLCTDIP